MFRIHPVGEAPVKPIFQIELSDDVSFRRSVPFYPTIPQSLRHEACSIAKANDTKMQV